MIDLGIIGYVQKGEYDATTSYEPMNCVYFNGGTYSAKQNTTGHAPTTGDENDQYWQTVVDPYGGSIDGLDIDGTNSTDYGVCSTAGATAAKTVSIGGTFTLDTGAGVTVKFSNSNTATNPTLNVNDTGAKAIYFAGAAIDPKNIVAGIVYTFKYNGTQWDLVGSVNSGHTIKDDDDVTYTNRSNLVFENLDVEDDSSGDATIVKTRTPTFDTLAEAQAALENGELKDGDIVYVKQQPGDLNIQALQARMTLIETNKQDKTDNSLNTTAKTIVGAINEHESDISTINTSLSDKVSKAGDTMTGPLSFKRANPTMNFIDMNGTTERHKTFIGFANSGGDFYIYDNTKSKAILTSKADGSQVTVNGTSIPNNEILGSFFPSAVVSNCNTFAGIGKIAGNSTSNSPSTNFYGVLISIQNGNYRAQLAISINTTPVNMYARTQLDNGFTSWARVTTS